MSVVISYTPASPPIPQTNGVIGSGDCQTVKSVANVSPFLRLQFTTYPISN